MVPKTFIQILEKTADSIKTLTMVNQFTHRNYESKK